MKFSRKHESGNKKIYRNKNKKVHSKKLITRTSWLKTSNTKHRYTYEVCKGCERSYLLQVTDTCHSPYQGLVEEETHIGHLSASQNHFNAKQMKENMMQETKAPAYIIKMRDEKRKKKN